MRRLKRSARRGTFWRQRRRGAHSENCRFTLPRLPPRNDKSRTAPPTRRPIRRRCSSSSAVSLALTAGSVEKRGPSAWGRGALGGAAWDCACAGCRRRANGRCRGESLQVRKGVGEANVGRSHGGHSRAALPVPSGRYRSRDAAAPPVSWGVDRVSENRLWKGSPQRPPPFLSAPWSRPSRAAAACRGACWEGQFLRPRPSPTGFRSRCSAPPRPLRRLRGRSGAAWWDLRPS